MFHAVIEHLNTALAASTIAVPLVQPVGTCVLIFSEIDPSQLAFWQLRVERISSADMATFYSQLETLLAELETVELKPKMAAIGLFGDQVLLVGKDAGVEVDRSEQKKQVLPVSEKLSAVAGAFHVDANYILADSVKVTFAQPVAPKVATEVANKNPKKLPIIVGKLTRILPKFQHVSKNIIRAISSLPSKIKMIIAGAIILMVVLILSLMAFQRWQKQQTEQHVSQLTQDLQQKSQAAEAQVGSNPVLAKQQLESVQKEYDQILNDQALSADVRRELTSQKEAIAQKIAIIVSSSELAPLATFFDLRLVQSDFLATRFALSDKTLLLLDPQPRKIMAIDLSTKNARMLPAGNIEILTDLTTSKDKAYYLGKEVSVADLTNDSAPTPLKLDKEDLAADFIRQFNDNLYIFSRQNRMIWRTNVTDKASSLPLVNWLKAGQPFEADQISDFAVDGDLWMATKDGKVRKFTSGEEKSFALQGISDLPSSPLSIYTAENLPALYVLEPQKSRLLIIDKTGTLIKEVRSSTLASATGIVVSSAVQKILILSGSQLFEVALP